MYDNILNMLLIARQSESFLLVEIDVTASATSYVELMHQPFYCKALCSSALRFLSAAQCSLPTRNAAVEQARKHSGGTPTPSKCNGPEVLSTLIQTNNYVVVFE